MLQKLLMTVFGSALIVAATPALAQTSGPWQGGYGGVNVGYGMSGGDIKTTGQVAANINNVNGGARPASVDPEASGVVAGIQTGYNWQFDRVVTGIEADFNYSDIGDNRNVRTIALNGVDRLDNTFEQRLDYLGTLRGRLGYTYGSTLIFGTGGLAYGRTNNNATLYGPVAQAQFIGKEQSNEFGYVLGGGAEHAINSRWSIKADYMYYDLADTTANVAVIPGNGGGGTGYNSEFDNDGHIIRTGVNYKF